MGTGIQSILTDQSASGPEPALPHIGLCCRCLCARCLDAHGIHASCSMHPVDFAATYLCRVAQCPELEVLMLAGNRFDTIACITPLKSLTKLRCLDLYLNPLTKKDGYRYILLCVLLPTCIGGSDRTAPPPPLPHPLPNLCLKLPCRCAFICTRGFGCMLLPSRYRPPAPDLISKSRIPCPFAATA